MPISTPLAIALARGSAPVTLAFRHMTLRNVGRNRSRPPRPATHPHLWSVGCCATFVRQVMGDRWSRLFGGGRRPLSFDATHRLVGGAGDYAGISIGEFDGQAGLADVDGDHLIPVNPAEHDFLPGNHDHPGIPHNPLHPDR